MGKNNVLIEQMKRVKKNVDKITPDIYAGIAISLHRNHGWGYKRINDLFVESQEIWNECVGSGQDMGLMCLEETGVDVKAGIER